MKGESIRILEQDHPFDAHLLPCLGHAVLVHEFMNVTVTVRFGLNTVAIGLKHHASTIVTQGWNSVTLLDNCDLTLVHTKVFVLFQQLNRLLVRVARRHDAKGQFSHSGCILFLDSKNILDIELYITGLARHFGGQTNLRENKQTAVD